MASLCFPIFSSVSSTLRSFWPARPQTHGDNVVYPSTRFLSEPHSSFVTTTHPPRTSYTLSLYMAYVVPFRDSTTASYGPSVQNFVTKACIGVEARTLSPDIADWERLRRNAFSKQATQQAVDFLLEWVLTSGCRRCKLIVALLCRYHAFLDSSLLKLPFDVRIIDRSGCLR